MSDVNTDTLDPVDEDTLSPENKDQVVSDAVSDPKIEVDAGEEDIDETVNDVGKRTWYDQLPTDMRNDPNITKYQSLEEFTKASRELVSKLGKDKVVIPTENSTDAEKAEFYNKLGRPEEADKYQTPDFKMPEGMERSDDTINAYKQKAYQLGLNQKQYEALLDMQNEMTTATFNKEVETINKMAATTETELRKDWGAAYEGKVESAQNVINKYFKGKDMHRAFDVLSSDKGFVRAMADIAGHLGEDVIKGQPKNAKTPADAQSEYNMIVGRNHPMSKAYFDEMHPEHDSVGEYMTNLMRMAHAGEV